jgi:hypothetical protein
MLVHKTKTFKSILYVTPNKTLPQSLNPFNLIQNVKFYTRYCGNFDVKRYKPHIELTLAIWLARIKFFGSQELIYT